MAKTKSILTCLFLLVLIFSLQIRNIAEGWHLKLEMKKELNKHLGTSEARQGAVLTSDSHSDEGARVFRILDAVADYTNNSAQAKASTSLEESKIPKPKEATKGKPPTNDKQLPKDNIKPLKE